MPVAPRVEQKSDVILGAPGTEPYRQARDVAAAAATLKGAVENSGLLAELTPAEEQETRAVLEAMPANVDSAFLASLRRTLNADKKAEFRWRQGSWAHEVENDPNGTVRLWLQSPPGDTLLKKS